MSGIKIDTKNMSPSNSPASQTEGSEKLPMKPVSFLRNGISKEQNLEARVKQLKESTSPGYSEWVKTRPCGSGVGTWGDQENQWRNGSW